MFASTKETAATAGCGVIAAVPRLLAPLACSCAPKDEEQGTWMYCDLQGKSETDMEGSRQVPLSVREDRHLVLAIDEF